MAVVLAVAVAAAVAVAVAVEAEGAMQASQQGDFLGTLNKNVLNLSLDEADRAAAAGDISMTIDEQAALD